MKFQWNQSEKFGMKNKPLNAIFSTVPVLLAKGRHQDHGDVEPENGMTSTEKCGAKPCKLK